MTDQLIPLQPAEMDEVRPFLAKAFACAGDAPFLEPALFRWKCFAERPDWQGPRSFVVRREGQLAAYGCVTPIGFEAPHGTIPGVHLIDWGGDPKFKGAGTWLMQELGKMGDINMTLGGSPATRRVLPRIGFRIAGDMEIYARPLRPLPQMRLTPHLNWKAPLRLARNLLWSKRPMAPTNGWQATRVERFEDHMLIVMATRPRSFTLCRRSAGQLNYMLQCPGAKFTGYLLQRAGKNAGYFVLSQVGPQARIADVLVDSEEPRDWATALSLATQTAAANPIACEVVAGGSIALAQNALLANGFRVRDHKEVFLFDPRGVLASLPPPHYNLIEADCSYVSDPQYPFLT